MPTPLPFAAAPPADVATYAEPSPKSSWWREPLLHFLLLGALLFAADHYLASRADDPHLIVVGADVDNEAIQVFKAARGRAPDAVELAALRRVWLDNEVLYREGLALQVDKGDPAIRDRVIFKALSVIDANTQLPRYDDALLRKWFEAHRDKYDEPARYDFQEAALSDNNVETTVRAFVADLNGGTPGDAKAGLRVFKGRPRANLVQSYGPEFAQALDESPHGEWRAQATHDGWRAIKLDAIAAPKSAEFEQVRNAVVQDWTDATLAAQRSAAVQALAKKYTINYERGSK